MGVNSTTLALVPGEVSKALWDVEVSLQLEI